MNHSLSVPTSYAPPQAHAIVLPWHGSLPYIANFVLIAPDSGGPLGINDCEVEEELLGLIPQVWTLEFGSQKFSWANRSLIIMKATDIEHHGGDGREHYLLYTCMDEETHLPRNRYLSRIDKGWTYGNAYLFKLLLDRPLEEAGNLPIYLDLDFNFIFDLWPGMSLCAILRALLNRWSQEAEDQFSERVYRSP